MRRLLLLAGPLLFLWACPSSSPNTADSGTPNANNDGGIDPAQFDTFTLDSALSESNYLSLAIDSTNRVGVAYFVSADGGRNAASADGGTEYARNSEVRYVEWKDGQVSMPQTIQVVQRVYGVSVAFQQSGEPAVAYLGGGSDTSAYWFQSDAVISYRSNNTWPEPQVAVQQGDEAGCPEPSNTGFLVGLNPALAFNGTTAIFAYRNGHFGQFPMQDWAASNLELAEGGPVNWTRSCLAPGGDNKKGYGAHISLVIANGQPALVHDRATSGAASNGKEVLFLKRNTNGTWTNAVSVHQPPVDDTQSGASLAFDSVFGFGIAVFDLIRNELTFTSSSDGAEWTVPYPVYSYGSGGWYPSLAFDPQYHEPAIAFYVCSERSGVTEGDCKSSEDELGVMQRIGGRWRQAVVDAEGGILPKLGFLSNGKRVVAYRVPATRVLRLAVER